MPGSNDGSTSHRNQGLCINPSLSVQQVLTKHPLYIGTALGPEVIAGKRHIKVPTFLDFSVEEAK